MQYTRQHVVDTLHRAGFHKAADEAETALPDPVDVEVAQEWAMHRGVTRDVLISLMGGSP
jgi:hypothetical protein